MTSLNSSSACDTTARVVIEKAARPETGYNDLAHHRVTGAWFLGPYPVNLHEWTQVARD